jgi:transcriptional antiterminator NusG
MAKSWYAVHTIAGHEKKVKEILINRAEAAGLWNLDIYEILIPIEQELSTRSGKRVLIDKKVFPGYILVQMNLLEETEKLVRSTSGVTGFVQSGNRPVPLGDHEIRRILSNLEISKEAPRIAFAVGDVIRVIQGPFSDYTGKIEEVNAERKKLRVLITIFGRDTPVELEFTQVEKV